MTAFSSVKSPGIVDLGTMAAFDVPHMGEFEQVVLLAVLQLGNEAYGMEVRQEIATRTGRDVSVGALYRTLARLEGKGFVSHSMGDPAPERGGRAKKFFRVEAAGVTALEHTHETLRRMRQGLDHLPGRE